MGQSEIPGASGEEIAAAESQDILKVFSRSAIMGDINVTPMVDVMLVLLIIFMVVTPALVAGFQAQLPQGINLKDRPEEEGRTSLGVDANGAYYLNKQTLRACTAERRADPAGRRECAVELRNALIEQFRAHPQDRVLFLRVDRSLKYQEVIDIMRLAKDSGARVIAAVTETRVDADADD